VGSSNIFLVGMMGAGKTTLGKSLAQRLQREFVDTDRVLVARTGVPVATIFEIEGEAGFRRRESAVLAELCAGDQYVVATGGGAVLAEANRRLMRDSGTVVYLRARLDNLWERTRHDSSRPLLAAPNPRERLAEILREREALYRETAHVVVDTGSQSASTLVNRVVAALREHEAAARGPA
jgi:shikimate kinase